MLNSFVMIADDEGGSGIFQFTSSGSMVAEDGSPLVQAIIARGGGNFGRVEVLVRTVDGRVGTSTSKYPALKFVYFMYWINNLGTFQTARSGLDYQPFSETLVFEVSLKILHAYHINKLHCHHVTEWTNRTVHYPPCHGRQWTRDTRIFHC